MLNVFVIGSNGNIHVIYVISVCIYIYFIHIIYDYMYIYRIRVSFRAQVQRTEEKRSMRKAFGGEATAPNTREEKLQSYEVRKRISAA